MGGRTRESEIMHPQPASFYVVSVREKGARRVQRTVSKYIYKAHYI